MADGVRLTFPKRDAFAKKLAAMAPAAVKAMGEANQQSAAEMADLARQLAPTRTGALKGSIRVVPGPRPGSFLVRAGGPATTKVLRSGSGVGFDYALGVEFGTKAHANKGLFSGSQHPGTRKQPFFFPSVRAIAKRMKSRASRALTKAIKDAAK